MDYEEIRNRANEVYELVNNWLIGINLANCSHLRLNSSDSYDVTKKRYLFIERNFYKIFKIDPYRDGKIKIIAFGECLEFSAIRIQIDTIKHLGFEQEVVLDSTVYGEKTWNILVYIDTPKEVLTVLGAIEPYIAKELIK